MVKTPGKDGGEKEKGRGEGEKGKGDEAQGAQKTQENIHFVGLNKSKKAHKTPESTSDEEARKPETSVDELPSPQEDEEEETENRQNSDDRRKEMQEAMAQTRKDAEAGSEMELALTPKGSTQSEEEEEKYQPTPPKPPGFFVGKDDVNSPLQQDDSESEKDSHQGSPRGKLDEEEERKNSRKMTTWNQ